ncbi:DUF2934 domain-containing protein [Methylotenera sp.]|uniref:DUF2934 domain-containing protein n=1 Tax=Methylotenera sp. TaxID=2051956 RepID=UPI002487858C|nr:DUF2934 domain-containing protein [Methylotenera sp.]MDI1361800.1 DUF2934 domain-containing protein [Methylotenera sp.]
MDLLKGPKANVCNPIPVIGIESSPETFSEVNHTALSKIAKCAYYKAEARGFEPGHEMDDWLAAEAENIQ